MRDLNSTSKVPVMSPEREDMRNRYIYMRLTCIGKNNRRCCELVDSPFASFRGSTSRGPAACGISWPPPPREPRPEAGGIGLQDGLLPREQGLPSDRGKRAPDS